MIQRKQTIFLLLAVVFAMACLCMQIGTYVSDGLVVGKVYNLWVTDAAGQRHFATWPLMALLLPSAVVDVCTIFLYQKRLLQARLCVVSMFLAVAWYIAYVGLTGEGVQPALATAFPAVSIILCFMARKAILADEKLVRSMDRIR